MKTKPLVSVGIAAYNEEKNIINILKDVCSQKQKGFVIDKIVIISDGSTDNTELLIKSIGDPEILLLADKKRKGKAERINQIFRTINSDIVIVLDADIRINSKYVFIKLIKPITNNKGIELTAGKITPLNPRSFAQKVVYTGTKLWDEARKVNKNSDMYYCGGAIRAFSKKLYNEMRFPNIKAEDIFPYLYCKSKGYKFFYAEKAEIYYSLPLTLTDYAKQMNRYLKSFTEQESVFDKKIVDREFSINLKIKLYVLFKELIKNPFWVCAYIFLLAIPKGQILFGHHTEERSYK